MVACEIAHALYRTPTKIARIRAREYTAEGRLFQAGMLAVDAWISPEQLVTEYVERLIRHPGALHVADFGDGRARLMGMQARAGGLLVGQQVRTLRDHMPNADARIAAIYRKGRFIPPDGDTVVEEGDEIFFIAARDNIQRMMHELTRAEGPVRKVIIAGGGNVGFRLAQILEKDFQVKVIERNTERAYRVAERVENTVVLNGDAQDDELLIEENIDDTDVFAAVTNSEEANVLSAMLAKRLGARKVLALVNRPTYGDLMENRSIDVVVSPQTVTMGSLLAHVRKGDVVKVHSLRQGSAEALEIVVHGAADRSRVVGRQIAQIEMPNGASIIALVRGERVLIAHHDTQIEPEDHVIVFLADRRQVQTVQRLFQSS